MFQRTSIDLEDDYFSVPGLAKEEEIGFFSTTMTPREMQYTNDLWNAVTFEMSFMHRSYSRQVYGTLDFLADIGGLFAALKAPFLLVISLFNFYSSYQFVMADNYVSKPTRLMKSIPGT